MKKTVNVTYKSGGKTIEATNPTESQKEKVRGQKRMLKEKQRTATWY